MKLVNVRIQNYRSINDSGDVPVSEITCLVGKNESGKTAFLRALHLLNPLNQIKGKKQFDATLDYPAARYSTYKKRQSTDPDPVVTAVFELSGDDVSVIESELGPGLVKSTTLRVSRGYSGGTIYGFEIDEQIAVAYLRDSVELLPEDATNASDIVEFGALAEFLRGIDEPHSSVASLLARIASWPDQKLMLHVIDDHLSPRMPKFFYFDDYSVMPGRVAISALQTRIDNDTLTEGEKAFLGFLGIGGADLKDFEAGGNFERLIRELEAAALNISREVFQFWSQNTDLKVFVRESAPDPNDPVAELRTGTVLNVRVENTRHGVSAGFDERSRGFVWFFSFFAYFSDLEQKGDVILLLDEPGLSLHGTAQSDFLRFIKERLAPRHQVLYTTHSPFMIDPDHYEQVRTVEDVAGEGTKVSPEIFKAEASTALPLLTKMGVDLFQTLMVGPNTLLVEGASDHLYVQLLTQALQASGRSCLDDRWVVVPVDGTGKFLPFVALYGANKLNVAVLMDSSGRDAQLVGELKKAGRLKDKALIRVGDVLGRPEADIEDAFDEDFYLGLVSDAYVSKLPAPITSTDLQSRAPRIVHRVEDYFQQNNLGTFGHYAPAGLLRERKSDLLHKLSPDTLDRAESLFARINQAIR